VTASSWEGLRGIYGRLAGIGDKGIRVKTGMTLCHTIMVFPRWYIHRE